MKFRINEFKRPSKRRVQVIRGRGRRRRLGYAREHRGYLGLCATAAQGVTLTVYAQHQELPAARAALQALLGITAAQWRAMQQRYRAEQKREKEKERQADLARKIWQAKRDIRWGKAAAQKLRKLEKSR